jgi:hypothetical protein
MGAPSHSGTTVSFTTPVGAGGVTGSGSTAGSFLQEDKPTPRVSNTRRKDRDRCCMHKLNAKALNTLATGTPKVQCDDPKVK